MNMKDGSLLYSLPPPCNVDWQTDDQVSNLQTETVTYTWLPTPFFFST